MLSSERLAEIFNKQIEEFSEQMMHAFPSLSRDETIENLNSALLTAISITPRVPINFFYEKVVTKYGKQLSEKNEKFFMHHATFDQLNPLQIVRHVYRDASEAEKQIIWQYIDSLIKLSKQYQEVKKQINRT